MNSTIKANVTRMFSNIDPCNVSASKAELGPSAARLTWDNAMRIAGQAPSWLESPIEDACEAMRAWAKESGGWEPEEIAEWSEQECLALFVQNIAGELRTCLDVDNVESLLECAKVYNSTDWDKESEYPRGSYSVEDDALVVDFYTGV